MKNKFLSILAISILLSGCDLFDDSPCGPKQTFDLYLLGSDIADKTMGGFNTYMEGNNRVFQWSELIENICTDEHVSLEGRVALLDETTTGVSGRAGASWQFLFEQVFKLDKNGSDLKGSGTAGLKQAFDKEAAWCVPKVEVFFPTKGTYDLDLAFLKENVISIEIIAKYRKF